MLQQSTLSGLLAADISVLREKLPGMSERVLKVKSLHVHMYVHRLLTVAMYVHNFVCSKQMIKLAM